VMASDFSLPRPEPLFFRRTCVCPACGLEFVVAYKDGNPQHHVTTRLDCPRVPAGQFLVAGDGLLCAGRVMIELPPRFLVLPALAA
jgi:hypothetical protein